MKGLTTIRRGSAFTSRNLNTSQPQGHTQELLPASLTVIALVLTLPFFGQVFYYIHEFPILYFPSKVWPILCLPFFVFAATKLQLPGRLVYYLFFVYSIGFTPLNSIYQLGNGFTDAFMTTAKIWPLWYYFSLAGFLVLLSPTQQQVRGVVLALGYTTFISLCVLWVIVPTSWYMYNAIDGKLFLNEIERGYRIFVQIFFGAFLLFYLTRKFMKSPHWFNVAFIIASFIIMITIYKQRTAIAAIFLVCVYGAVASLAPRPRLVVASVMAGVLSFSSLAIWIRNGQEIIEYFGNSLYVRQASLVQAADFLGESPWRWLFGVGGTTRFGSVTIMDILGNDTFYIADLGWFGIVFEYGLIGAALLAWLYIWGLCCVLKETRGSQDPFMLALSDYVLFMMITTIVYSPVYTPGELGVVMALAVYLNRTAPRLPSSIVVQPRHQIQLRTNRWLNRSSRSPGTA